VVSFVVVVSVGHMIVCLKKWFEPIRGTLPKARTSFILGKGLGGEQ